MTSTRCPRRVAVRVAAWALILAQGGFQAGTDQAIECGALIIGSAGYAAGWIILGIDAVRRDRSPLGTGRAAA